MNDNDQIDDYGSAYLPSRQRVNLDVGAFVQRENSVFKITQILDFESAIGVDVETGRSSALRIDQLRPVSDVDRSPAGSADLDAIADEDWRVAESRFAAIKPIVDGEVVGREAFIRRAAEVGVDVSSLYRWWNLYKPFGLVSALIPRARGWKPGKSRISPLAETVVAEVLRDFYLTDQRRTPSKTITEIQRRCLAVGIQAPSDSAIRLRIGRLSEREKLRRRGYAEKARNRFLPTAGKFPGADYPLAVIQIDHTPADIILVDDVHRKPIGRPWITLAIDVFSRMVTGYYLSFDPPSEASVAMCVAHSILPKEDWLALHNVDAQWPVWGLPKKIHVDNGADFRSNNFQKSCLQYAINLEFRPVKQPRYGGHIERLLGTVLREIHDLPGTTFSSVKERDGYDSEKRAVMTKSEFEEWLVGLICKIYHGRKHSALMMSPLRKWEIGVLGNGDVLGVGMQPRPTDRHTVLLDFLPSFHRTVQTFGTTVDNVEYYSEALRPWINAVNAETGKKQKFIFRRDPRDISALWFYDPALKQYFKVPYADLSLPSMSIWEYAQVTAQIKKDGSDGSDPAQILRAVGELRTKVDKASENTKIARRQAQRRKEHERKISPADPLRAKSVSAPTAPEPTLARPILEALSGDVTEFGEIE
ncbi:transposase [Pandoraea captiosa]|uniref:Transposase n=1 Tax=Pandoraea captiosa TaxID=2508302 RepID=A0A5E4ZUT6_9BURK|nr:Mu transposase C-terminal domain-containing protein [Pandoraea captiosa]VVE64557.1 transposase [Pandoraea captiosa]